MAQEITATVGLSVANGAIKVGGSDTIRADQTTAGAIQNRQSIPTTAGGTVISFTGITAPRWVKITNKDPVNFVSIGPTVSSAIAPLIDLKPGESCVFPLTPTAVLRGLANVAAVLIEKTLIET